MIPFLLKKAKFEELAAKDSELKKYYKLQDNGFYKADVPESDRELLKDKFRTLGFSALNFTDSRSIYQFYNLGRLWQDILTALFAGITLWHPATEPISAGELYEYLTGENFVNELGGTPTAYDYKTIYAETFGRVDGYICSKQNVFDEINRFVGEGGIE